jgi:prolyl-tRNA synthetase
LSAGWRWASHDEIAASFDCVPGYLGPVGIGFDNEHKGEGLTLAGLIVDHAVPAMSDFVVGANQVDAHLAGVNWGRDLPEPTRVADLRNVVAGDPSPDGRGQLAIQRGIEVGHVFYLGTKYSEAMRATFLDESGRPAVMEMGCYGIGVTRVVAAAIEQNHDEKGIVWPLSIAPFEVVVCLLGAGKSSLVREAGEAIYAELLSAGLDVILDDRDERPGVMFADWELIGVPIRVTVGERSLKEGQVEWLLRRGMQTQTCRREDLAQNLLAVVRGAPRDLGR